MKIWIDPLLTYRSIIRYTLQLAAFNRQVTFHFVTERSDADFFVSEGEDSDLCLYATFYHSILKGDFNHGHHLGSSCLVHDKSGRIDHLATIYYCSNSLQERGEGVAAGWQSPTAASWPSPGCLAATPPVRCPA